MSGQIPSPNKQPKPFEREAVQEIVGFTVAFVGVALQVLLGAIEKAKQPPVSRLAGAMYGPDREERLSAIAHADYGIPWWQYVAWFLTIAGVGLVFYYKYLRAKERDSRAVQAKSPEGLSGCANVICEMLKHHQAEEVQDDGTFRVTIFRVVEPAMGQPATELEQVIDYLGKQPAAGSGRVFPIFAGVIGRAARTGEPQLGKRTATTDEDYIAEIVSDWGYPEAMARAMTLDRRSFIAVPIKGADDKVIGIVYADSKLESAFEATQNEFIASCNGVASYIKERYK